MAGPNRYKVPVYATVDDAGLRETIRRLKDVDRKAARRGIRKGINEVTKLILASARALVPKRTGLLRRSLGRKVRSRKDGAGIYGVVKPRGGIRVKRQWVPKFRKEVANQRFSRATGKFTDPAMADPVKYAHLVEHGRAVVTRKRKKVLSGGGAVWGVRVRAVAGVFFMRRSWERYRPQAPSILRRFLEEELRNFWTRSRGGRGRGR